MTDDMNIENANKLETTDKKPELSQEPETTNKKFVIISIITVVIILTFVVMASFFLLDAEQSARTAQIRDVFIIFLALESLIIGIAMVVLIVQLSTLINLLQNEIRPIINSTNETVNTLKGTAQFVSDHLTEPVIKINQFMAMIKKIVKPHKN